MSHQIALNFEDGVTRFVDCVDGETVADAAYRAGINVPLDCRDGACGTCKCHVQSGLYDGGSYIEDALTDEEATRGLALACQMRPKTDCAIDIAATAQACKTAERSFSATLRAVDRLSDSSFALTLDADAQLAFLPGQYAKILVPDTEAWRSYSFSSAPSDAVLSFLIRNLPNGAMSSFLAERARPGLTMNLTGPLGSFYLRDIKRPLLFVAGGTGIAPFLSMLGQLARMGANERPIHLLHGVSYDADLVAVQQLDTYAAALPGFSFTTSVSRAGSAHPRRGHVTDFLDADHLHGGDVDVYVCGPPGMVDALRDSLSARGVTPANLYTEKFLASGNEPLRNAA